MQTKPGQMPVLTEASLKAPPPPPLSQSFQSVFEFASSPWNPDPAPTTSCERGQDSGNRRGRTQNNEMKNWGRRRCEGLSIKGIELTERDYGTLKLLYENIGATQSDLISKLKIEMSEVCAIRRLRALRQVGLIQSQNVITDKIESALLLTKLGHKLMRERVDYYLPHSPCLAPKYSRHDLAITKVRLIFENNYSKLNQAHEWIPERLLKKEAFQEIPDGILKLKDPKRVIAVEIENTLKSRKRLRALFERWSHIRVALVLYVSTQPGVHRSLVMACKEFGFTHLPLAFITLDDLQSANPRAFSLAGEIPLFNQSGAAK